MPVDRLCSEFCSQMFNREMLYLSASALDILGCRWADCEWPSCVTWISRAFVQRARSTSSNRSCLAAAASPAGTAIPFLNPAPCAVPPLPSSIRGIDSTLACACSFGASSSGSETQALQFMRSPSLLGAMLAQQCTSSCEKSCVRLWCMSHAAQTKTMVDPIAMPTMAPVDSMLVRRDALGRLVLGCWRCLLDCCCVAQNV